MSAALTPFEAAPRLMEWVCHWCRSPMASERIPDSHLCPGCERLYERSQEYADEDQSYPDWNDDEDGRS